MESPTLGIDWSSIPVGPNPDGSPPNFIDPPSLAPAVFVVGLVLTIVSVTVVSLRLFTNWRYTGKWDLDDYLCLFAEIGAIGYWGIVQSFSNIARHTWDLPISAVLESVMKKSFAEQILVGPVLWTGKAAILALYIRLFGTLRWLRITAYSLLIFMFLFYWSNIVIAGVYCAPQDGISGGIESYEKCEKAIVWAVVNGVFGVIADIVVFLLPSPAIYKLRVSSREKLGLWICFMVGFLSVAASVASLVYKVRIFQGNDPIWNTFNVFLATFGEVYGTIIVSCTPSMSSFWRNIFTRSKFYLSLRSRFTASISRSTTGDTSLFYSIKNDRVPSSVSHLRDFHNHKELHDRVLGQCASSYTRIYSPENRLIPMEGVITKSDTIDQTSQHLA